MPLTTVSPGLLDSNAQYNGFKNRIINGDMVIDQRNNGASVTANNTGAFTLDRWRYFITQINRFTVQQNAGSVTPPPGFTNYLGVTSSSAYSIISSDYFDITQPIEGFNIADLAWGTANAQPVTVSFWVRSSLTGTFGGSVTNSAYNRSYPFPYTISSANTWEYKTITIPGDTTGTWLTNNGRGIELAFGLGNGSSNSGTANTWQSGWAASPTGAVSLVGTNGATLYITGVQLERGQTATSFDVLDYGTELQLCQRYYYRASGAGPFTNGYNISSTLATGVVPFPVPMRTVPSALEQTGTASNYRVITNVSTICNAVPYFEDTNTFCARVVFPVASGLTGGQGNMLYTASGVTAFLAWSAEL